MGIFVDSTFSTEILSVTLLPLFLTVIVAVPGFTPVTTALLETVATFLFELDIWVEPAPLMTEISIFFVFPTVIVADDGLTEIFVAVMLL